MTTQPNESKTAPAIEYHPYEEVFIERFVEAYEGCSLEDIARQLYDYIERARDEWEADHSWN